MLEIDPDFKHFMGILPRGWVLASQVLYVFQASKSFFELAGDKLRIFRVRDDVGGDEYH